MGALPIADLGRGGEKKKEGGDIQIKWVKNRGSSHITTKRLAWGSRPRNGYILLWGGKKNSIGKGA